MLARISTIFLFSMEVFAMTFEYTKTADQAAPASSWPTAADAFFWVQADRSLNPTQRRDRLSALCAIVRICRPIDDGNPTAADLRRDAHLVSLTCASLNAKLFSRLPSAFGFRSTRT